MAFFTNNYDEYIFIGMILLWILSEVIGGRIIPALRHGGSNINKKANHSSFILVFVAISFWVALFMVEYNVGILPDWVFYPGILLMAMGIFVRQWSIFVLGSFFTPIVSVQKNQKVVDYGPYRYVRHPSYLGIIITVIGVGLALHSLGAIIEMIIIVCFATGYRVYIEEKFLVSELGNDYIQYMKRTKRLIPFIL